MTSSRTRTFPALLDALLRDDPGRPLLTFYDGATGERTELSRATYGNWVAKTASLLVDELDLDRGDRLLLDLPTHWLGPVFLGAAWSVGLVVLLPGEDGWHGDERPDGVACGPAGLDRWGAGADRVPVVASALLPMGVRFGEPPPVGVLDFGVEVWGQPDAFVAPDLPGPDDEALPGRSQAAVLEAAGGDDLVGDGGRLMSEHNPASASGLHSFTTPLVRGGSTVWLVNTPAEQRAALAREERVDRQHA